MPAAARLYPRLGPRLMLVIGMLGTAVVLLATAGWPWAVGAVLLAAGAAYGLTIVALQTSPFAALASGMLGRATAAFNVYVTNIQ
jgi:hypothetical protein